MALEARTVGNHDGKGFPVFEVFPYKCVWVARSIKGEIGRTGQCIGPGRDLREVRRAQDRPVVMAFDTAVVEVCDLRRLHPEAGVVVSGRGYIARQKIVFV